MGSQKVREIGRSKFRALVYGALLPTTVTTGYVTGLAGAQMAVRLPQTTQIIPSVHTAYVSTNKTKTVSIEREFFFFFICYFLFFSFFFFLFFSFFVLFFFLFFFFNPGQSRLMFTCVLRRYVTVTV